MWMPFSAAAGRGRRSDSKLSYGDDVGSPAGSWHFRSALLKIDSAIAAWVALAAGLYLQGDVRDAWSFALAGVIGAAIVAVGFAAASRCRGLAPRGPRSRVRLALLSLALGTAVGVANLAANWAIAASHPTLRMLLAERMTRIGFVDAVIAAPFVEEVVVRLFLMSVIAWLVSQVTRRAGLIFAIALVASAVVFAVMHLDRPMPADRLLAGYYRAALLAKYTMAGVALGWSFWRWGLPYSILCHGAVNAVHLALEDRVF
jgi:membrane protease YdiL (CAAX protease family)